MDHPYENFTAYLMKYGFTRNPLSKAQFQRCQDEGLSDNALYGIACDMNAGLPFADAYSINKDRT